MPSSYCEDELYEACNQLYPFSCGSFASNISYPFWGKERRPECGKKEFKLTCIENLYTVIEFPFQSSRVLGINTTDQTVTIKYYPPWDSNLCPERPPVSAIVNQFLSNYSSNVRNLSLFYNCTKESLSGSNTYTCQQVTENDKRKGFYTIDDEPKYFQNLTDTCSNVTKVPILFTAAFNNNKNEPQEDLGWLREILDMGLQVNFNLFKAGKDGRTQHLAISDQLVLVLLECVLEISSIYFQFSQGLGV
ncbi:hypothetical protein Pint_16514 [Pistacia integerrima]|uniref:Uncharacterized protein n=1 Tax=Pistacia integerrima TaxID=434235 RepID=A0ACC0ZAF6_9ROSI|nr:hypothetical protein Pint_16514 [Pistacia integerrima]